MKNLKKISPVDEILTNKQVKLLIEKYNRDFIVNMLRRAIAEVRQQLRLFEEEVDQEVVMQNIYDNLEKLVLQNTRENLQKVINGTGVVLHTNLGRAPLGEKAISNLSHIAKSYNNLEMDLEKGIRGSRYQHVEQLLTYLTGAEDVLVVNNNAAAVMLGLKAMAENKEVIVSRGQLVEIGGAFRLPEVMKLSGAKLVEIGTTNKTYIADYASAINDQTALLFSAHTSNYKIVGFSEEVKLEKLAKLGKEKGIPVMQDLGSGILYKLDSWGLKDEPTVQECVASGADIITFSGDKLLGGPQSGIIVGKKEYIEKMKRNQLLRAMRVDKLTVAALEGTLIEYIAGKPQEEIPVIRMLTISNEELKKKAEELYNRLSIKIGKSSKIKHLSMISVEDMVGGGAYPTYKLPGYGIELEFFEMKLESAAKELRLMNPALLTRKQENKMVISVRTLLAGEVEQITELLVKLLEKRIK
jgi:L-seryl-tRNA(Ser) seleniumtransferase